MAIVIKKGNFSDKLQRNIVYLHCVEQNLEVVNIVHLACLSIRVRCAHISFIDMLSERSDGVCYRRRVRKKINWF